jgi:tol-pal system protein YbgF
MRFVRPKTLWLAPAVFLLGGCFATRSDMRILQGDILTLRQEQQRADSVRARQIAQVATSLAPVQDSLRALQRRLDLNQGESRGEFRSIRELIIQLQELIGQNQAVLARMRAENEARATQVVPQQPPPASTPVPPVAGDTGNKVPAPPPDIKTGPNELYQLGLDQARRGSYGAAQAAFEELLREHPTSDLAPDAQYFLAVAYDDDGKYAQADSAYTRMVRDHSRSPRASTALYKMGLSLAKRGRRNDARAMMERITKDYPVSDAADLARDWLMRNR